MTSMLSSKPFLGILPNHLTYFRVVTGFVIPVMILSRHPWLHLAAFALFGLGAISDYFDGWLARRYHMVTETGKWLDPLADKVLVLGCFWALSRADQILSYWFFIAVLIREVVVTFCRTGWVLGGQVLGAEKAGKWKLFSQTILIVLAFLMLVLGDAWLAASWTEKIDKIGDIIISITMVFVLGLTWYSGVSFLWNHRVLFRSSFFAKYVLAAGVGLLPKAPGTWGSIVGVILAVTFHFSLYSYLSSFLLIAGIAYFFFERFKGEFDKDPQFFVLDEVCGIFVALVPMVAFSWTACILGFLLFRVFDIWKPFPIRRFENLPGYWGIMADDLMAGLYAAVILWLLPL